MRLTRRSALPANRGGHASMAGDRHGLGWVLVLLTVLFVLLLLPLGSTLALGGQRPGARAFRLGRRVLVLAPHPDDEVLGAGGAIAMSLAAGDQVWVALATSGESSVRAAIDTLHVAHPTPSDFARLGQIRRDESRAGTSILGLPAAHLIFLGYADGSLTPLWLKYWDCRHPRVSGGIHVARSLLANGFHPHVAYCAPDLLADLGRLFRAVQPDAVVLPDLADQHPDHAGLAEFAWAALMAYDHHLPPGAPRPRVYGYLVHYPGWPSQWGSDPDAPEHPPDLWIGGPVEWLRLPLTRDALRRKEQALLRYRSQLAVSATFLQAFVRRDELFTCRPLVLPLGRSWNLLGQVRPLYWTVRFADDGLPGIVLLDQYGGPATTLLARAPHTGEIELRLAGPFWLDRPLAIRLYAWQVRPGGPFRRLQLSWRLGHVVLNRSGFPVQLPTHWRLDQQSFTWDFTAGNAPWQVAASLVYPGGQVHATPWLAVSAGRAERATRPSWSWR